MLLYSLALLLSAAQALPAPSFNETSVTTSAEVSCSDSYRSLWSIISTCLLTIFASVYTAIHINIPSPYDGPLTVLRRKAGIMIVAVLAPELIVGWAARQWISARAFTKEMRDCLTEVNRREQDATGSVLASEQQPPGSVVNTRTSNDSHRTLISLTGSESVNGDQDTRTDHALSYETTRCDGSSDEVPLLRDDVSGITIAGFDANDGTTPPKESCETEITRESYLPLGSLTSCESPLSDIKITDVPKDDRKKLPAWRRAVDSWIRTNDEDETWTTTHSLYAYMGGFMVYHNRKPWRTITPIKLREAVENGNISPINLTKKEIADASKGNFISKGLVVLQVTWFCVQLIARRVYGLAATPLEIGTAGFAALCFITYALWWNKPLSVDHPRRLEWKAGVPPDNLHKDWFEFLNIDHNRVNDLYSNHILEGQIVNPLDLFDSLLGDTMGNLQLRVESFGGDDVVNGDTKFFVVCFIGTLASTVFGLVHITAWGLPFPTRVEKIMWEVGAILIVCIPLAAPFILYALITFGEVLDAKYKLRIEPVFRPIGICLLAIPYVVSRVALIAIMFTSLRSLPPSSFETIPWAELIPHL